MGPMAAPDAGLLQGQAILYGTDEGGWRVDGRGVECFQIARTAAVYDVKVFIPLT